MAEQETTQSESGEPLTPGAMAFRYLQTARKMTKANGGVPDEAAQFLISSANVMALLELADAVRGGSR